MRKILEISLYEDGLAAAGCDLRTDLDGQRLAAALVSLAQEDALFQGALFAAVYLILGHPDEVKEATEAAKASAVARLFGGNNKNKS